MDIESFREYCLSKKGVTEGFPFDEDTLVFKVMNKMFALTSLRDKPFRANLKCDPERAIELRETYDEITPGYHMNKVHWNTVVLGSGVISHDMALELIDHSYSLIVDSLPRKVKQEYDNL